MGRNNKSIIKLMTLCIAFLLTAMLPIQVFAAETDGTAESVNPDAYQLKHIIEVDNILQLPDLPTGCESVSLTIVLKHFGYPANKLDLVRNYLPKQEFYYVDGILYGADFETTFAGDPEDENSYGCYAPCMVITANNYLTDNGYKGKAYNLTGIDFEMLLSDYIDNDIPIMIWITNYELEPSSLSTIWKTPDGKTVQWRRPEHCAVLTGYDRVNKLIYVSDPIYGNRSYDYDKLIQRFNEMGNQAIYIDALPDNQTKPIIPDKPYTPSTPDTPNYIYGDIDFDGNITANDALLILRSSVGLETFTTKQSALADIDSDNTITSNDALAVLRFSVGLVDNNNIGKTITE